MCWLEAGPGPSPKSEFIPPGRGGQLGTMLSLSRPALLDLSSQVPTTNKHNLARLPKKSPQRPPVEARCGRERVGSSGGARCAGSQVGEVRGTTRGADRVLTQHTMAGSTTAEATVDGYYKLLRPTKASYTPDQLSGRLNLLRRVSPTHPVRPPSLLSEPGPTLT